MKHAQVYPMPQDDAKPHCDNIADDPEYEPIRQIISTIVLTMMSLFIPAYSLIMVKIITINSKMFIAVSSVLDVLASVLIGCFFVVAVFNPKYLGGKPALIKIIPAEIGIVLQTVAKVVASRDYLIWNILVGVFFAVATYVVLLQDDTAGSWLLIFKPWVYKKKQVEDVPQ